MQDIPVNEIEEILNDIKKNYKDCRNIEILGNASEIKKSRFKAIWHYWGDMENPLDSLKNSSFRTISPKVYQRKRLMFDYYTTDISQELLGKKHGKSQRYISECKKAFIEELSIFVESEVSPPRAN